LNDVDLGGPQGRTVATVL